MSGGYPTIPTRDDLGPEFRDLYPPENPETDFGADALNLVLHQVAGLGMVLPVRAVLIARYDSTLGAFVITHQEEAWNTRRAQARPVLERVEGGQYVYTFPTTVLDRHGNSVPYRPVACRIVQVRVTPADPAQVLSCWLDGQAVNIDAVTSDDDFTFWLEVY
jgi:hypothetical protein